MAGQEITLLQEQVAALQRELEAKDDQVFELSATLATVEAETKSNVEKEQEASRLKIRGLEEQLRRTQQEANLAAAARKKHASVERERPVISPTERLLRQQQHHQQQQQAERQKQATQSISHRQDQLHQTTTTISLQEQNESGKDKIDMTGTHIARHILSSTKGKEDPSLLRTLGQCAATPVSTADFVFWLILEFLHEDQSEHHDHGVSSDCHLIAKGIPHRETSRSSLLNLILDWLYSSFSLSRSSCRLIIDAHAVSLTAWTENHKPRKARKSGLRATGLEADFWRRLESKLESPMWHKGDSVLTSLDCAPTPVQCRYARRFMASLRTHIHIPQALQLLYLFHSKGVLVHNDFLRQVGESWICSANHLVLEKCPKETAMRLRQFENDTENAISKPAQIFSMEWMADALNLIRIVWKSDISFRRRSLEEGLVFSLLSAVADVLERLVLPDYDSSCHVICSSCLSWLHSLTNISCTKTCDDRFVTKQCWVLLRTRQATNRSTPELWHRADTVISVAVSIFHTVTIRMRNNESVNLTAIQHRLVRFFHSILLAVQEDRRQWEKLEKKRNQAVISFLAVFSECQELYTSSAASLLAGPEDEINQDMRAMLTLQMDELAEDQMERQILETG